MTPDLDRSMHAPSASDRDATAVGRAALLLASCCFGLLLIGIVSAASSAPPGEMSERLRMHGLTVAVALFAFLVALRAPIEWTRRATPWIVVGVACLLVAVLIPGVGRLVNGGRRWLTVAGFSLQPSELAKVALLLFLADFAARSPERLKSLLRGFLPAGAVVLGLAALILPEPDLGTALYLVVVGGTVLAVAGAPTPYLIGSALLAVPGILFIAFKSFAHVGKRSTNSYQVVQSLRSLGEGGFEGVGFGAGRMKLGHVPEGHNDFVLALVGEEWGLAGTGTIVLLYLGIVVAGVRAAKSCRDPFARLLAFGVPFAIAFQAAFNIAVVTGWSKPKGIALPFVSLGGSALLAFSIAVGLALNVLRREAEATAGEVAAFRPLLDPLSRTPLSRTERTPEVSP